MRSRREDFRPRSGWCSISLGAAITAPAREVWSAPMSGPSKPRDAEAAEDDQPGGKGSRAPRPKAVVWVVSSALFSASIAVLAWIAIGHRSVDDPHPDYVIHPPRIPVAATWTAGIVALLVSVTFVSTFAWAARRSTSARRFLPVIAMLTGAGVLAGLTGRMLTDGVIGANIGAGLMVMFGGPTILSLLVFAAIRLRAIARASLGRD